MVATDNVIKGSTLAGVLAVNHATIFASGNAVTGGATGIQADMSGVAFHTHGNNMVIDNATDVGNDTTIVSLSGL